MERTPTRVLQRQLRHWRSRRNLSAQGLADRIAEMGGTLSRAAISKIENGDRGVTVDEWLQLAHALAVPPPLLLIDLETGRHVELTKRVDLHPWIMWSWIRGEFAPPVSSPDGTALVSRVEEFSSAQATVDLYNEEEATAYTVQSARSAIRSALYVGDQDKLQAARTAEVEALRRLANVMDRMIERGITPPGKPAEWIDKIRELELSRFPDRLLVFQPGAGKADQADGWPRSSTA